MKNTRVHFFIGTKAQCIKMAPVMAEMDKRGLPYRYIDSGQHAALTRSLRTIFGLRSPDVLLRDDGEDVVRTSQAMRWYLRILYKTRSRRWLQQSVFPGGGICLIHGDTLSTLLGLQMAKRAGLQVAHVEAGLRSFRYFDPFPEELIRIWCMKHSDVLFAPSQEALTNLETMRRKKKGWSGSIVPIGANTVWDTMRMMEDTDISDIAPDSPYGVVTCHRLETLTNKTRLSKVVDLINRAAKEAHIVFVMHKPTKSALKQYNLLEKLEGNITSVESLDYKLFLALLRRADFILTDGGSIQEECALLNKPCLVLRNKTEREDGIGMNAMLWEFEATRADEFFRVRSHVPPQSQPTHSPSAVIVDTLEQLGFF